MIIKYETSYLLLIKSLACTDVHIKVILFMRKKFLKSP